MKFVLLLLVLSSCTSFNRVPPTIRSPYSLTTNNGFIISNIYSNPADLERNRNNIIVKYDLIIKNATNDIRDINLQKATVDFRTITIPLKCSSFEKKEESFKVNAQETFRIQCEAKIKNQGNPGDTKMLIQIPLDKTFTTFGYIVRAEDFQ